MNNLNFRFIISLIANLLSAFVGLGISLLLTPFLITKLGKEAYSFFPIANNFVSYMSILVLALNSMAGRYITICLAQNKDDEAHSYFSSLFLSNLFICIVLSVPMVIIVAFATTLLNVPNGLESSVRMLFTLIFASLITNTLSCVFNVSVFVKERMDIEACISVFINVLKIILYIALFAMLPVSLVTIGFVALILSFVESIIRFFVCKRLLPSFSINIKMFRIKYAKELFFSGIWNAITSLGQIIFQSVSVVLTNILISPSFSADVAIAQTLPTTISLMITALYNTLLTRIVGVFAKFGKDATVDFVRICQRIMGVLASTSVMVIILFGQKFFQIWLPLENAKYLYSISLLLLLPYTIQSAVWPVHALNISNNTIKVPAMLYLASGLVSIILCLLFSKTVRTYELLIPALNGIMSSAYILSVPLYASKMMKISCNNFFDLLFKSIGFYIVSIFILRLPINNFEINNWFTFLALAVLAEVFEIVLYIIVVINKDERRRVIAFIKELRSAREK